MKYKVMIDRNSITLNTPLYNSVFATGRTIEFKGVAEDILKYEQPKIGEGIPLSCLVNPVITELNVSNDIQEYHRSGTPAKYSYSYIPKKVKCSFCNKKFLHTNLGEHYDDDSDYHWERICPECHQPNCVELIFEEGTEKRLDRYFKNKKSKRGRPKKGA